MLDQNRSSFIKDQIRSPNSIRFSRLVLVWWFLFSQPVIKRRASFFSGEKVVQSRCCSRNSKWVEHPHESCCRAVLYRGMLHKFCYKPVKERIRNSLPLPMDKRSLNRAVQPTDVNSYFPRILNRDFRPVFQYVCGSFSYHLTSNLIISGIPYAWTTYLQYIPPVYALFSWNDRGLEIPASDPGEIIAMTLS
jgi:hypothetical protein